MMKRRTILSFVLALGSTKLSPVLAQSNKLTISAAISLQQALEKIKTIYQKSSKVEINYNFASSGTLQQQIEQGAPVDIFISAATKQMDALEAKNLIISTTRRNLLTNQLVLITPKQGTSITSINDLTKQNIIKIAVGEPRSVPAGQYANEVFKYYKIQDIIQPKLIYARDVRQVLTYVQTGNVDAGLVYLTDAQKSSKLRIVARIPPQAHQAIVYPVAIIKGSKSQVIAKDFLQFLYSKQAKDIFKKYGFGV